MIVAGFGFRASATASSLSAALHASEHSPSVIAAPEDKAATPVFAEFAQSNNLIIVAVTTNALQSVTTSTQSTISQKIRGTGSVAEACALAAAGAAARLVCSRVISPDGKATCAIATGEDV
ncbi:MAG: cobalamin biosynthesis protein [Rhodobacteraceae bacterium]|nr:cobalamin biosynthesis protein [Paracoccaceae bacterium]